jgi:transcriptional regulator with XRE-family HTH domain
MDEFDPAQFWSRFQTFSNKDLPVILKTGIKQSTLSTWRIEKTYPRADDAVRIALALKTTVEFLVTGSDSTSLPCTPVAAEIAIASDKLNDEGKHIVLAVVKGLAEQYANDE